MLSAITGVIKAESEKRFFFPIKMHTPPSAPQYQHLYSAYIHCMYLFCTVQETWVVQIANSVSLYFLNMSANKNVHYFSSCGAKAGQLTAGRGEEPASHLPSETCPGPLGAVPAGARWPGALGRDAVTQEQADPMWTPIALIGERSHTAAGRDLDAAAALQKTNQRKKKRKSLNCWKLKKKKRHKTNAHNNLSTTLIFLLRCLSLSLFLVISSTVIWYVWFLKG